ncbi:MAG TPA: RHS repeat-associated core domain-containing protein, partial [Spirochaetota bacterium]|nr:RHS repeat-associated core domain-containing protein [Spirochaetota bacterium]
VTKAGAMVFTYDDNGNMIKRENTETKNTMTLVWDDENRLIKTTDSLHTTDYRYDANGERIIKKSELGETQYVSANYIVRNKTVISKHIFAGNQRVASTVSMKDNCGTMSEKNTMYFHPDHLGSSSYVTDKKGNFFEMIEYLPYGETLYDEAATVDKTEFRFTGKEMDAETGLYYYGARYYDAKTSRFISADDRFDDLYSAAGLNIFAYCHNNPVRFIDPSGHDYEDAKGNTRYGDKGNNTPAKGGEFGWKTNDQIDEKKVLQTDPKLDPSGETACCYRAFGGIAESYAEKTLTVDQINEVTEDLVDDGTLDMQNGKAYNVMSQAKVIEATLKKLDVDTSKLDILVYTPYAAEANNGYGRKNATATLRGVYSSTASGGRHWQEGFSNGSFRWDPAHGKEGANRELRETWYIIIRPKKEKK